MATANPVKTILGTAQIGAAYGMGRGGHTPAPPDLLAAALQAGVTAFDAAQKYGAAEWLIGDLHRDSGLHLDVTTKLDPALSFDSKEAVLGAARASVRRLGEPPAVLMVHRADAVEVWGPRIADALTECVEARLAQRIGVSVYTPEQFEMALSRPELSTIQAPLNVLDDRLLRQGLLDRAAQAGKRVQLRSVFLQGLLTLDADELPPSMAFARPSIQAWTRLCAAFGVDRAGTALRWVADVAGPHSVIIGCQSRSELDQNLRSLQGPSLAPELSDAISRLPSNPRIIDPRRWP